LLTDKNEFNEMNDDFAQRVVNYLNLFINEKINLLDYANRNQIGIYNPSGTVLDKGWKGNVVEHILNLKKNNHKGSDFENLEIKTVPVLKRENHIRIKESTCLSVLDADEMLVNTFITSNLYKKIKNTLFVFIDVENKEYPYICQTYLLNLETHLELREKMNADYDLIAGQILDNLDNDMSLDFAFSGKLGEVIQPRPKTGKKGNYTWAFYLKAHVLTALLNPEIKETHDSKESSPSSESLTISSEIEKIKITKN
jgi:DNA mismatch repair protein MutH